MLYRGTEQDTVRSTSAVVDLTAIGETVEAIRAHIGPSRHLMAVVKADGYGHGAVPVSLTALEHGATWLGVALPEEGMKLRAAGITARILVMGLVRPDEAAKSVHADLDQAVDSVFLVDALDRAGRSANRVCNVHLKLDTGMRRIGVSPDDAVVLAREIQTRRFVHLAGVFSHLAKADHADKSHAREQIAQYSRTVRSIEAAGIDPGIRHIANSAAVLDLPNAYFDMVRPGIMLYGLYPSPTTGRSIVLRPAMELRTRIAHLKILPAGTPISYGGTHITAREKTLIATLPVGYGDGYRRNLSNSAEVWVGRQRAPIVGTVCMDMCMVDVSAVPEVQVGDPVILFGREPTADEIADRLGTINYEVVCGISRRVPRHYITAQ